MYQRLRMSRNSPKSADNDPADEWRQVYQASEAGLRAFLRGRLGQEADVEDCLQVVYVKTIESGDNVAPGARRAWLFRVAANESARFWRRKSTTDRVLEKRASYAEETVEDDATDKVIQTETSDKLRQLIETLPESTQEIIRLRIQEGLTFQQISDQLKIPIGTALTRMRRGLERLRTEIDPDNES